MTRKEVEEECIEHYVPAGVIISSHDVMIKANVEFLFDLVFNEINSRTCENCEHYGKRFCQYLFDDFSLHLKPEPDFGCIQFKRRRND